MQNSSVRGDINLTLTQQNENKMFVVTISNLSFFIILSVSRNYLLLKTIKVSLMVILICKLTWYVWNTPCTSDTCVSIVFNSITFRFCTAVIYFGNTLFIYFSTNNHEIKKIYSYQITLHLILYYGHKLLKQQFSRDYDFFLKFVKVH